MSKNNKEKSIQELRNSGAEGKYSLLTVGSVKLRDDRKIVITKIGDKRYSPIMVDSMDELDNIAYEVADIIEKYNRETITFWKILEQKGEPDYPLKCKAGTNLEKCIDTDSKVGQSGFLSKEKLLNTIKMKQECSDCPFMKECLAVSMTSIQTARMSKNSKIIPKSNPPLALSEFLIFGGYTPQEREIIFDKVCEILEEYDALHEGFDQNNNDSFI